MPATSRQKTRHSSIDALEQRIHALLERAQARAQKRADEVLAQVRHWETNSWHAEQLRAVEKDIRDLSRHSEDLTPYGREQLKDAKAYRSEMRKALALQQAPFEESANAILTRLAQCRKETRRAEKEEQPRERLLALLTSLDPLRDLLTQTDLAAIARLKESVKELAEAPESPPVEEEPAPTIAVEPLPPQPWEFEQPSDQMLAPPPPASARDLTAYRLNRAAQQLSLVRGFDVLLTPQLAHGLVQYPHQIETARAVLRRMRGRALLCDEVGLGKTIEAGIIAGEYAARGLIRRILVLAPPALVSQWRQEMREKFDLDFITHDDPEFRKDGPRAWAANDRIIASINTARLPAHRAALAEQEFDLIIVDEAHHLRSRTSQSWKLVNDLKKRYVLLLTATPVQNDLEELFNLITLLSPGQLKTSSAFRREFVVRGDPRTPRNRERLRQLMGEVMIRNTRSQVNIAMPPRIATTHRVRQSPEEACLYAAVTGYARQAIAEGSVEPMALATLLREAGSSAPALAATLERMWPRREKDRKLRELIEAARAVSHHAKAERLCSILSRRHEKTVVFTFFRETLHLLERALAEAGISYATLSGEQTAAEKDRALADFAADRRVLLSSDVGSEGRNLQFCYAVLNFDLPWNPMRIEQRVGRVHRIGQKHEVLIDNLCATGTIEDYILRLLDEKLNMFELVVGEIGVILGNLEVEQDFESLALDIWTTARNETDVESGFESLGEKLREAQSRYRAAQEFDIALFGDELATPVETEP